MPEARITTRPTWRTTTDSRLNWWPSQADEKGPDSGDERAVGGDPGEAVELVRRDPPEISVLVRHRRPRPEPRPPDPQGGRRRHASPDDAVEHHLAEERLRRDR